MIKWILNLLLLLLFATGCKTKHLKTEKSEEKERKELKKDSLSQIKNEVKTYEFTSEIATFSEIEIVSDKEKDIVTYERIRSPTSEKIIVRGGSLKLKIGNTDKQLHRQNDTLRVNNTSVRTTYIEEKSAEKQVVKKEKKTRNFLSLWIVFWIILIAVILFIAWRFKLFKLFK